MRLIVGYAPGGAVDFVSRLIAEKFSAELGQQVVVANRPGGGPVVAGQALGSG